MQPSQPARGKLVLRSSHRTPFRLGISHTGSASTWTAPSKDKKAAPAKPSRR